MSAPEPAIPGLWTPDTLVLASLFSVIALGIVLAYRESTHPLRNLKGPSPSHPLYGNLQSLLTSPTSFLQSQWFSSYGSTLRYRTLFQRHVILTQDPITVAYIHSHPDIFDQPDEMKRFSLDAMGPSLTGVDGADHRRQRRAIAPSFSQAQIKSLTDVFLDKAQELVECLRKVEEQVDMVKHIQQLTVDVIGSAAFDCEFGAMRSEGHELLESWKRMINGNMESRFMAILQRFGVPLSWLKSTERSRGIADASEVMKRIGRRLIEERKRAIRAEMGGKVEKSDLVGNDLLTNLLRANMALDVKAEQRMSDEEVLAQIPLFLFAGNTTVAVTLTWAVGLLAKHSHFQQRLREELLFIAEERPSWETLNSLPYLDAFVHEILRLYPAAPTLFRVARADSIIPLGQPVVGRDGSTITSLFAKKGTRIHIAYGNMNLSEVFGVDPEEFNPHRFLKTNPATIGAITTFGGGARHCIGSRFAIAEIKAVLFVLVRRFSFEEIPSKPEFTRFGGLGLARVKVGGKLEMPLIVTALDEA